MKLTKTKLKQFIKEELGKVLGESADVDLVALLSGEDEKSVKTTAMHHGWEDYQTGEEKWADAWEAFEGGKYIDDYYLGYDNAAEAAEEEYQHGEEGGSGGLQAAQQTVLSSMEEGYASLADDSDKIEFEEFLLQKVQEYTKQWRADRQVGTR